MIMLESLSLKIVILILTVIWLFSTIGCLMRLSGIATHHSLSDLFIELKELQDQQESRNGRSLSADHNVLYMVLSRLKRSSSFKSLVPLQFCREPFWREGQ